MLHLPLPECMSSSAQAIATEYHGCVAYFPQFWDQGVGTLGSWWGPFSWLCPHSAFPGACRERGRYLVSFPFHVRTLILLWQPQPCDSVWPTLPPESPPPNAITRARASIYDFGGHISPQHPVLLVLLYFSLAFDLEDILLWAAVEIRINEATDASQWFI